MLYTKHYCIYLIFHTINIYKKVFIFNKKHYNSYLIKCHIVLSIKITFKINIQNGGGGGGGGGIHFPPVLGGGGGGGGGTIEAFCGGGGSDDPL